MSSIHYGCLIFILFCSSISVVTDRKTTHIRHYEAYSVYTGLESNSIFWSLTCLNPLKFSPFQYKQLKTTIKRTILNTDFYLGTFCYLMYSLPCNNTTGVKSRKAFLNFMSVRISRSSIAIVIYWSTNITFHNVSFFSLSHWFYKHTVLLQRTTIEPWEIAHKRVCDLYILILKYLLSCAFVCVIRYRIHFYSLWLSFSIGYYVGNAWRKYS